MALLKNNAIVDDPWTWADRGDGRLAAGPLIVGLEHWRDNRESLLRRNAPLGVCLHSDQQPECISRDLAHFDVVALEFPKFTDGRAYSHARLLRERYDYLGEIRAVGNVLRDQLAFMSRSGFDAFEIPDDTVIDD